MSERERKIIETITTAISGMSEFDKGYLLGMGEAMASKKQQEEAETETDKDKEKTAQEGKWQIQNILLGIIAKMDQML